MHQGDIQEAEDSIDHRTHLTQGREGSEAQDLLQGDPQGGSMPTVEYIQGYFL